MSSDKRFSHHHGLRGYDYVEFYVGSAKMSAFWHVRALGLNLTGYKGPETGCQDYCSYYLTKNDLKIVLTSPLKPESFEMNNFITRHGDGVKRWAIEVDSVEDMYAKATDKVAVPVYGPTKYEDEHGYIVEAAIKLYDDLELVFINHDHYKGVFRPGYTACDHWNIQPRNETGLEKIDHIVGNVRENEMDYWANYLNSALDFETFIYFGPGDISTRYSALLSQVVHDKDDVIKNPINEPYEGVRQSQIEEFLKEYHGSGVQHIAIHTSDIISTIDLLRANGVTFIEVPEKYYDNLIQNAELREDDQKVAEDIEKLKQQKILCDLEGEGYLLQTFTKPMGDRPTFFYEIIQRCKGAKGFGQGNFQSLFEAIELDQMKRGTLTIKDKKLSLDHH